MNAAMFTSSLPLAGKTVPQRLMSRSRPDGVIARVVILTLVLLLISYLIFGIVQAFTSDKHTLLRGKMIMLGSMILIAAFLGAIVTPIITTIRKELDALID
jgi:hypothetical protein